MSDGDVIKEIDDGRSCLMLYTSHTHLKAVINKPWTHYTLDAVSIMLRSRTQEGSIPITKHLGLHHQLAMAEADKPQLPVCRAGGRLPYSSRIHRAGGGCGIGR